MIDFTNAQIPAPQRWQDFEELCADLWQEIWGDPGTEKHGRSGQQQHGVDIYGRPDQRPDYEGVQCKGKDGRYGQHVTETELKTEVEKAKEFYPRLKRFILATTAPNDKEIQLAARKITEEHLAVGLFAVEVLGWDEIQRRLASHPNVIDKHYRGLFSFNYPQQPKLPNDAGLQRVKAMARTLLEAGKRSWKMPRFVAPLTLEAHMQQDNNDPRPVDATELWSAIEAGDNLVLFGAGGIGKTTFLLDLCTSCLNGGYRIALYVDVAVWARTNASLLDYLLGMPSARANEVTSAELTKLAQAGRLVIMLNGWNEIVASSKLTCRDDLIHLSAVAEALSFVVVSRASRDVPSLPNTKKFEVRGLAWQGQAAVVRAELGDVGGAPLLELLAKDTRLRHAARSPLILRGLIAQAQKGAVADSCVFDLLNAAVQSYEEDDQRHLVLALAPVDGHQRAYLEELACLLTKRLATNCSRDDALQAIHTAATRLAERHVIGITPNPSAILDMLVSHHLLHLDNGVVRFAHQRFQEFFAATRLFRHCIEEDVSPVLLTTVVNQPSWDEALALVAGKLKGERASGNARVRIVNAAAAVDLGLACDMVRICAFTYSDSPELHNHLVNCVNKLAVSPLKEIHDLGVAYQIASGLPAFAEKLWPILEIEDQQTRLSTFRLNGSAISLAQLGTGAVQRIGSWSSERRVEFVHETADNADNYDFLVRLAQTEFDPTVRAAAISALFWYFPASDVPLQAWLDAPIEVQTEHNVLSCIQYALDEGYAGDAVRERLLAVASNDTSDSTQLHVALAMLNEVGPRALDVVFERLRNSERHGNDAPLVTIARAKAPQRLLDLAQQLALQARGVPAWVEEYLRDIPVGVRNEIFDQAWVILQGPDFNNLNGEILGPLASREQIQRSVDLRLQHDRAARGTQTDNDRNRYWQLDCFLANASGGDLLSVVMQCGQTASYNEAAQLVELVLRRIGRDDGRTITVDQWLPTVDEVRQLVALFAEKVETAEVPQDTVRVYLCAVASHVAPAEFGQFLLETCRRHLDAWSVFREKVNQWSKRATPPRPRNPELGLYLSAALARWGHDALPGLLELMTHPSAMESIPEAMARIVTLPWASKRERLFFSSVSTDIQEGEQRRKLGRELRQPVDIFQYWTDEVAKALGLKLNELVTTYTEKKSTEEKWNAREGEHRIGNLAGVVASIPSAGVVDPVHSALASGLMDILGTVRALRGLVSQGLYISDSAVVGQLEALYEHLANREWLDDSTRHAMSELTQLIFCVRPASLLSKSIRHYLQQWRRFSHDNEIVRCLGSLRSSEAGWPMLVELGSEFAENGRQPEEFVSSLLSALTPQYLANFLALVADGTIFGWCRSQWTWERLAPKVADVLNEATDQVEQFLEACRQAQSPLADTLAGNALCYINGCEEARECYLLEALDVGRGLHSGMPVYQMLTGMFIHKLPINDAQYEIIPKANNRLRAKIYARAKDPGPIADGCRCLLASLECGRRERGRPDDELRHPMPDEGLSWTYVLVDR
ncbi:MAG: hypothetical protein FD174_2220 [Geobacteraceae bacterium]|nr:MAG: hypothetical protein FD174_2220 [Geobacteraceae bacterium]